MASDRRRLFLTLACVLCAVAGCTALPASKPSQDGKSGDKDEYEGWLYKSLTGKKTGSAAAQPVPRETVTDPGVRQASATTELPADSGPLVAGPASAAGPPPTIPDALPPPPSGAISVSAVKLKEEEKKGFEMADLAPENIYKNIKKAAGYGPNEKIAKDFLEEGKKLFHEKKFQEAGTKFATAADRWPDSPLEEDALFLEGESEFFSDQYSKAHDTYGGLLKKYANTRHLDTVMRREFAIGVYWEQAFTTKPTWPITPNFTDKSRPMFDTFGYAVQAYERIRMNDPQGPLADDSLMVLGNAYFQRGRWEDSAYNYDLLCKEYPNSNHQLNAHLFGLQANMRRYQGTAYDDTPLRESRKLADGTLSQFGDKLGAERERVAKARAQIREEQANRDYTRAKYYEGRHCYGAARLYYMGVIKDFPGTEMARKSQEQYEKIRNEPDEPPGLFRSLFKSNRKVE
jgi:TolA-binding protein